jgi:diguanylate cyclase (GGDEF)-like protein
VGATEHPANSDRPAHLDLPERMLQGRQRVLLVAADGAWGAQLKRSLRALRGAEVDVEHVLSPGHAQAALATAGYDAVVMALSDAEQAARAPAVLAELAVAATEPPPIVVVLDHAPQEAEAGRLLRHADAFLLRAECTPGALAGALEIALRQHRLGERLRSVLESSPDGMLVLDEHGRVRYANRIAGALLGTALPELIGATLALPHEGEVVRLGRTLDVRRSALERGTQNGVLLTLRDVTAVKQREAELAFAAEHDPLTTLANAARLHRDLRAALARSRRDGTRLAVLYLDMDGFKAVNDTYGHATGDALLRELGARLAAICREGEVIGRLGGDEFAMVAENVPAGAESRIAERLIEVAARPLAAAARPVTLSMSIGIATTPEDGHDPDALLRAADAAMYAAKRAGRNTYRRAGEAQGAARRREQLAQALRVAVLRREFEVVYQPLFDLDTGHIQGAEALLRWRRQPDVLESPAVFLEVAEETGLINALGDLVADALCREWVSARWLTGRELDMALNLSPRELRTPGTFARLRRTLANHGVPGRCLSLEVREDVLAREVERVAAQAAALDGVTLAVGDMSGDGLSLRHLAALPVRSVKLSRTLVEGATGEGPQAAMVSGLVALAGAFGLRTVAEGVETAAQAARLRALGCRYGQGYYFSPPLAEAAFRDCLAHPPRLTGPVY